MTLVVTTQSLHLRQVGLPLRIDPLDICGVALEVTPCRFVDGVALLICKARLHTNMCNVQHPSVLSGAGELLTATQDPGSSAL